MKQRFHIRFRGAAMRLHNNKVSMKRAYIAFLLVLMYVPIAVVIIFSFNASRLNSVWSGFSLSWYSELFRDRAIFSALRNSLVLAALSSLSAAVIGTMGAVGMEWGRAKFISRNTRNYP
ncbi:MAG: hypothetical protein FWH35_00995, partial [Treponema sp.]|nr:hypothetical protein [Treponema sp.]